jgi:hypothetical protein
MTAQAISYESIPTEFRSGGFNYRQIAREGDLAIYEQKWTGCPDPSTAYEVVRIRRHDGFLIAGKAIEPAEFCPKSEDWGIHGWTVLTKDRALEVLKRESKVETGARRARATIN